MEWVTNLSLDIFKSARFKLTAMYTVTMMVIIVAFSVTIFQITSRNIRVRPAPKIVEEIGSIQTIGGPITLRKLVPVSREQEHEIRKDIIQNLKAGLIIVDLWLLGIVSVLGYILAGLTLRPIKRAYMKEKRFVQNISHDLKTPLAIMRAELEVELLSAKENTRGMYQSLLEEANAMTKLVDELFFLSQMDSRIKTHQGEAEILPILENRMAFYATQAEQQGIILIASFEAGRVGLEEGLVKRVLDNILSNAFRYTKEGEITVSGKKKGVFYEVTIRDTGVGISKKDTPHIFERFYKGDASRTKRDSSGLGLAIVEEIMKTYKGKVHIYSIEGKGTTVTLCFPVVVNVDTT